MNVTRLGSSTLNIPFAFPDGDVSDAMSVNPTTPTSDSRAEQLLVLYWDGIDEGAIMPLTGNANATSTAVLNYLMRKGVTRNEAASFINAMLALPDKSWLSPRWSYTKTVIQDTTGTGAQGKGGSKAFDMSSLLFMGAAVLILYGVATTATSTLLRRK